MGAHNTIILGNYQCRGVMSIIAVNLSAFSKGGKKSRISLNTGRVQHSNTIAKLIRLVTKGPRRTFSASEFDTAGFYSTSTSHKETPKLCDYSHAI